MKTKTTNKKTLTQKKISEGLEYQDLKGLVSSQVMIDLHKPKVGGIEDTVVVAFDVTYEEPARDLSQFIETGPLDHLDVEVAGAPDPEGKWKVFVEFVRDHKLYSKIKDLLDSVDQITSNNDDVWEYRAFNNKQVTEFTEENFDRDIITSRYEYKKTYVQNDTMPGSLEEKWQKKIQEFLTSNV